MTARDRIRHIVVAPLCASALPAFGDALPSWNGGWLIVDMERDCARVYPYDP